MPPLGRSLTDPLGKVDFVSGSLVYLTRSTILFAPHLLHAYKPEVSARILENGMIEQINTCCDARFTSSNGWCAPPKTRSENCVVSSALNEPLPQQNRSVRFSSWRNKAVHFLRGCIARRFACLTFCMQPLALNLLAFDEYEMARRRKIYCWLSADKKSAAVPRTPATSPGPLLQREAFRCRDCDSFRSRERFTSERRCSDPARTVARVPAISCTQSREKKNDGHPLPG